SDAGTRFAGFTVPPGTHSYQLGLLNNQDSTTFPCTRSAWIDSLTLVASRLFSPASYFNQALASNTPLDADQSLATGLANQIYTHQASVSHLTWTSPIYVVPASQPVMNVAVD